MNDDAEAQKAIEALNEFNFRGRPLTVNEAKPREDRGGGRGGYGGGGGGGRGGYGGDRYEAPSPVQGRWSTRTVEFYGTEVPAGSKVLLLTGSAGRDEREYQDADRFDIHRRFNQHVSFGFGIHFCLGAALARLEGRVALEEALRRHPAWEVDRERAVRLHTSTVRGWSAVPVS